ncbi:hypothetical protein CXG81DRAFT_26135 [Caulochytrium protostelioides]|uniref:YCII-related domain-containing protein n=1 Tax=Caulochytrium protostelioides TaxID=1555241 RepID=A0A4P9X7E6_9FUNG|nr:hypothetical protein CXG81DRAFT_26135 [Caulochytrium protostelioides]|eukprot:RKP01167.1 hypothetical protein CXG81DRAFT_26135 [Caulochytrium protostelioides]
MWLPALNQRVASAARQLVRPRGLASSAMAAGHFVLIAHDHRDSEALERRLKNREAHVKRAKDYHESGEILAAGPLVSEHGPKGQMTGSCFLLDMPTRQDVEDFIGSDPYTEGKVWGNIEIYPMNISFMSKLGK